MWNIQVCKKTVFLFWFPYWKIGDCFIFGVTLFSGLYNIWGALSKDVKQIQESCNLCDQEWSTWNLMFIPVSSSVSFGFNQKYIMHFILLFIFSQWPTIFCFNHFIFCLCLNKIIEPKIMYPKSNQHEISTSQSTISIS